MAQRDQPDPDAAAPVTRSMTGALLVLTGINLLNYIDRYIVPPLVGSLKAEWQISDAQAGLLVPSFLVVYMIVSPIFGALADRGGRTRLIAIGVALWSVATMLGGLAGGFVALLLTRSLVGVGEAAYGTIAPALLADYFPKSRRGRMFAIFYMAMPVGAAIGYIVGGAMNQHFGWRSAFFIAGVPGLILALLTLRLPNPPIGAQDGDAGAARAPRGRGMRDTWAGYRALFRNGHYATTVYGYAAYTFGVGALSFWMPEFIQRTHHLAKDAAAFKFGIILVITGFTGTWLGGWVGDRMLARSRHAYLLVSGIATIAAAPFAFVALTAGSETVYLGALVIGEILIFASTGPVNSAIVDYVSPTQRATAMGLSILAIHVLGDSYSPSLIGWISDHSNLQHAMMLTIPSAILVAGLIWTLAALRWSKERLAPA